MVSLEWQVMSFSRWTQYVKLHQPGVCLTRTAEDVCDSCVRIDIQLARDDLLPEEWEHLVLEKGMHLQAAINQHRVMLGFIKQYIAANAPQQPVPNAIIFDTIDVRLLILSTTPSLRSKFRLKISAVASRFLSMAINVLLLTTSTPIS
ncbi:unnamed protein product [Sphagnum jensenii]|uniref:Uncharacterized protein n=1 Tax=Sphagnum jensenii TaxID=128206 RepID=A0ABP1AEA4_9BRYO